jgi:hypothetical protein
MPYVRRGDSETLHQEATTFLNSEILDHLSPFTYHINGSYSLDTMAWPDIDIFVLYESHLDSKIYEAGSNILESLNPCWLELRNASEEQDSPGHFFLGFETTIISTFWNIDIWFQPHHQYRESQNWLRLKKQELNQLARSRIVSIKHHLIDKGVYSNKVSSIKVYEAVLDHDVREPQAFDDWYSGALTKN